MYISLRNILLVSLITFPLSLLSKNNQSNKTTNTKIYYGLTGLGIVGAVGVTAVLLHRCLKGGKKTDRNRIISSEDTNNKVAGAPLTQIYETPIYKRIGNVEVFATDSDFLKAVADGDIVAVKHSDVTQDYELYTGQDPVTGFTPYDIAVANDSTDMIEALNMSLWRKQGSLFALRALKTAVSKGSMDMTKAIIPMFYMSGLFSKEDCESQLFEILWEASNHNALLKYLIEEENADIDVRNELEQTLLIKACDAGDLKKVFYLLNDFKPDVSAKDAVGNTADSCLKSYQEKNPQLAETISGIRQIISNRLEAKKGAKAKKPLYAEFKADCCEVTVFQEDADIFKEVANKNVAQVESLFSKKYCGQSGESSAAEHTVVEIAIATGCVEMVQMLKRKLNECGCNFEDDIDDYLEIAASYDNTAMLDEILLGLDAEMIKDHEFKLLKGASHSVSMFKYCMQKNMGLDLNAVYFDVNLLIEVCLRRHWKKADILIDAGIDLKFEFKDKTAEEWLIGLKDESFIMLTPRITFDEKKEIKKLLGKIKTKQSPNAMTDSFVMVPTNPQTLRNKFFMAYAVLMINPATEEVIENYENVQAELVQQDPAYVNAFYDFIKTDEFFTTKLPTTSKERAIVLQKLVEQYMTRNAQP